MSPSQPHVSHFIVSHTPSLTVNSNKQQITHKALNADVLHTDRHSRYAALQLLQQPVFNQYRSLGFLDSTRGSEYVGKNKSSSVTVEVWNRESATNPLIIILANMWSWLVSFTLRPS